jgi:hypothetical protein
VDYSLKSDEVGEVGTVHAITNEAGQKECTALQANLNERHVADWEVEIRGSEMFLTVTPIATGTYTLTYNLTIL